MRATFSCENTLQYRLEFLSRDINLPQLQLALSQLRMMISKMETLNDVRAVREFVEKATHEELAHCWIACV